MISSCFGVQISLFTSLGHIWILHVGAFMMDLVVKKNAQTEIIWQKLNFCLVSNSQSFSSFAFLSNVRVKFLDVCKLLKNDKGYSKYSNKALFQCSFFCSFPKSRKASILCKVNFHFLCIRINWRTIILQWNEFSEKKNSVGLMKDSFGDFFVVTSNSRAV